MKEQKIGLPSVVATGVGVIVATSCLLALGVGAGTLCTPFILSMVIACAINILFVMSVSELNALMPNLTGGLAQYTLACMGRFVTIVVMVGGYLAGNAIVASIECAMFGNTMAALFPDIPISATAYSLGILLILIFINFKGIRLFATLQNVVVYGLIFSVIAMGLIGWFGIGTGELIDQPAVVAGDFSSVVSMCGLAFFLFIASEFVIPIGTKVKNPKRNIPLGMILSLIVILVMQSILILGFQKYTLWADLAGSASPHILYGTQLLGTAGMLWMSVVTIFAVISTVNTNISSLSYLAQGMSKIDLLPAAFNKTNKNGSPYIGILFIGGIMLLINLTGLTTSESLNFLILCACVFMMVAYILVHINVLILRKRLPNAPRNYKVPFGPVIPIVGSLGIVWMLWNLDPSLETKLLIYGVTFACMLVIAIYAVIWLKFVIKKPMFKPLEVKDVMAMENEMYQAIKESKRKNPNNKENMEII